jgi:hypothetical protein
MQNAGFTYKKNFTCNNCEAILPTNVNAFIPRVNDWYCDSNRCRNIGFQFAVRTNCRNCNKIKPIDSDNVYGNPRQIFERIDKKAIDSKVEKRLMVIILNIPYAYNENDIISEINNYNELKRYNIFSYNCIYFPNDFMQERGVRYCFVTFPTTNDVKQFFNAFENKRWYRCRHSSVCQVRWSNFQVVDMLKSKETTVFS